MSEEGLVFWIGFNAFVVAALVFDLCILRRKARAVTVREAAIQSLVWVTLALAFNAGVLFWKGPQVALQFFTGYIVEYSLSVDNIFVFLMLFSYFSVPAAYQHRVLFWGILGAIVMRGSFIVVGSALLARFEWIMYIFGGFLVLTGIKMGTQKEVELKPDSNPVLKLVRRFMPVTDRYQGQKLIIKRAGRLVATPLLLVLVLVETTDLLFALDSIPAVLAISRDPFIVYTSNVFAILGLRSLYFLLAGAVGMFRFLKYGLSVILTFVGAKMLLASFVHIPIPIALMVIVCVLASTIAASVLVPEKRDSGGGHRKAS